MATGNPQTTATSAAATATATATATTALSAESLTFDGIAKHFNMPIADAAVALGVCSSVLKKICRDNGLVRWPYRKFLAGKSVEEIQKDAAREKKREMLELARAARQKDAVASSVTASSNTQQQGNNLSQDGLRNDGLHSGAGRNIQVYMDEFKQGNIPAHLDEFKQGFPSNGLSIVTMRWWGGHSSDATEDEILGEEPAVDEVNQQHTSDLADEEESKEEETNTMPRKSDTGPQGASLLLSVRERAAVEGRQALKLGVYGGHRSFKLNRREKLLLLKVFRSSLPKQWIDSS